MFREWLVARLMRSTLVFLSKQVGNAKWTKPSKGIFKWNIDAYFSEQTNRVVIGVCIKDDTRTFVLTKTKWFSPIWEVHVGEALGLLSTLDWTHELNLWTIYFEFDAKKMVDSFSSSTRLMTRAPHGSYELRERKEEEYRRTRQGCFGKTKYSSLRVFL